MRISKKRISYLLKTYSTGKASLDDEQELFRYLADGKDEPVKKHIAQLISSFKSNEEVPIVDWEHLYQNILKEKNNYGDQPVLRKMIWARWVAAAALLFLLGTGYYFLTAIHKEHEELSVTELVQINDIAPPHTVNAVLTLSDGQKIVLDSSGNGVLANQGSVNVIKLANGEIAYRGASNEIQYNTLSNPRGSKVVNLVLADGSRVWLNTASSLRYPTAFSGNERKVEITGEAYLEIAHNPAMPFIVSKDNISIKVLGTHFNVSAYDDESTMDVTLLEGSVSISAKGEQQPKVIKPGEQAAINKDGSLQITKSVDLDEVMAWKNGIFSFKGTKIENIMKEVSRWYDVNIVLVKEVDEKFYAEVSRNTSVSTLLKMLEATNAVHFKIYENTISVMP